jgi:hypothetical protein
MWQYSVFKKFCRLSQSELKMVVLIINHHINASKFYLIFFASRVRPLWVNFSAVILPDASFVNKKKELISKKEVSDLFGRQRDESFKGILNSIVPPTEN